jgi:hypothetical protein
LQDSMKHPNDLQASMYGVWDGVPNTTGAL